MDNLSSPSRPAGFLAPSLLKTGWRSLLRRPLQSALMVLGIVLGVAVVIAIDIANVSASTAFDESVRTVAGRTTHQIVGGSDGVDEATYFDLRRLKLPAAISPTVSVYVTSPQLDERPYQLLGIDPITDAPFRDFTNVSADSAPFDFVSFMTVPNSIVVSELAAADHGLKIGDTITISAGGYDFEATITGMMAVSGDANDDSVSGLIVTDISNAQEMAGRVGRLSSIDLIVPEDVPGLLEEIESHLPDTVTLTGVGAQSVSIRNMTASFRINLQALSLLGLVVGMFLIYNTVTFSVLKRLPLFGTLRNLGVTRHELFALILVEVFIVGLIGTSFGILAGIALGQSAVRLVSQTINDLYFVVLVRGVQIPSISLVKGGVMGILATVVSAIPPALDAANVNPREVGLRSGAEGKARKTIIVLTSMGIVVIVTGVILLLVVGQNSLVTGFAGTFAVIVGCALLTPACMYFIVRTFSPLTARIGGTVGRLAPGTVLRSLSRTAIATAALMIAISVSIGIGLMVQSFRYTVTIWLQESLQGDIYVSLLDGTDQNSAAINPQVVEKISDFREVVRVDTIRTVAIESNVGPINLLAVNNPYAGRERMYVSTSVPEDSIWDAVVSGSILVSEPYAIRAGLAEPGQTITLPVPSGTHEFEVVGIYHDYSNSQGAVIMDYRVYERYWHDTTVTALAIRLNNGADPDQVSEEMIAAVTPIQALSIRPNGVLRADVLEIFDRTFAITGALQILATIVAFIGILSALLAVQLDNQREFGLLQALGLTLGQLRAKIMLETGLMGMSAGLLAIPTGYVLSLILVYIINRRAFGWTIQLQTQPEIIFNGLLIALLASLAAGLYPAWAIGKKEPAESLRYE